MRLKTKLSFIVCLTVILFVSQSPAFAGMKEEANFKQRIQGKLEAPRNVQYEPYYLSESWSGEQQTISQSEQAADASLNDESVNINRPAAPAYENIIRTVQHIPTLSYVIYNTKYTSQLEENVVTVKGDVIFEVFGKEGSAQIPLVSNTVGLIDVRVNKGASFVTSQGGKYYLIMNKPGRYNLDFEFLIKASREREHGPGNFSVDVVPAPISQFEFSIPENETQIFIEPAIKVETSVETDKTSAWAVLPNTNNIQVRWTRALPKEEIVTEKLTPKVYAETSTYAAIGGGVVTNTTNITYSILQAEISSMRVALPEDVSVLDVNGNDLRDWKVSTKDGTQYVDVFLNFGVKGSYQLNLTYERNITEGSTVVQMPWVKAMNTERENGYYGIAVSTNVELAVKNSDKVTPIDIKQLPNIIWSSSNNPILLAFKYLKQPFDIAIEVTRHEELPVLVAAIDSAHVVSLHTKDGKILTKATYNLRNNVKQFLRLDLPAGSKIWSSFVSHKPVKPAMDKEGHILLPLEKSQMTGRDLTQFPVEVVYLTDGKKINKWGSLNLSLPKADVPINQMFWQVYFPFDYTYYAFDSDMRKHEEYYQPNFINMGIQGRFKSASDDIGDQYSMGVTQSFVAESKQMMAKGVLPITINVPEEGKMFSFSKLIVIENETPSLTLHYSLLPDKIWLFLKIFVKILFYVLILFFAFKIFKKIFIRKPKMA